MLVRLLQSVSFFAVSVSWIVYLLSGKQPDMFVTAMFVTLGGLLAVVGVELSIRTYRLATGGV
jgi:hypothetical protein